MDRELYVGQRLRTITREFVTIKSIDFYTISIEYRGKIYNRPKDIVEKKLFILPEDKPREEIEETTRAKKERMEKLRKKYQEKEKVSAVGHIEKSCKNCMDMRRGECFGRPQICEFFRYAPTITDKEKERWPDFTLR